jgi:hypothetical protein
MCEHDGPEYFYSSGIDPARRSSSDQLFLLIIEARPEPEAAEYCDAGGAFVACLIDADDLRVAEQRAVALIQERSWRPHRFEKWVLVTRATYADGPEPTAGELDMREIVDQTFIDGEVAIFNTWDADAPDADDE